MAQYPTSAEVTENWTDEQWATAVKELPSYHTAPIVLAKLEASELTPEIIRAWADLAEAIRFAYHDAQVTATEVNRPQTDEELRTHAASNEASRVYTERVNEEKRASES
jgi:hypothetical protein